MAWWVLQAIALICLCTCLWVGWTVAGQALGASWTNCRIFLVSESFDLSLVCVVAMRQVGRCMTENETENVIR